MSLKKEFDRDKYIQEIRDENTYQLKKDLFLAYLCKNSRFLNSMIGDMLHSDFIKNNLKLLTNCQIDKVDNSILLFLHTVDKNNVISDEHLISCKYLPLKNDVLDYELYNFCNDDNFNLFFSDGEDSDTSDDTSDDSSNDSSSDDSKDGHESGDDSSGEYTDYDDDDDLNKNWNDNKLDDLYNGIIKFND